MTPNQILQQEGFVNIYEWDDKPNTKYPEHSHKGNVTIFIKKGNVKFYFSDGTTKDVSEGERFDVPVGLNHKATVGKEGCSYIVGEMIEGDS